MVWRVRKAQQRAKLVFRNWCKQRIWIVTHDWGVEVL